MGLFANIEGVFWVVLLFGGSILVHELGHFFAAKVCKLRIDRFSIGFGPKLWKRFYKGTEYCLSILPFGGYVAIPQLADMSLIEGSSNSNKHLKQATLSQKVIVSIMGACFNILLACGLATILWIAGVPKADYQQTTVVGYVEPCITLDNQSIIEGPAKQAGIQPGDSILKVDGNSVDNFESIRQAIMIGCSQDDLGNPSALLTIKRDQELFEIIVKPVLTTSGSHSKDRFRIIGIQPAHEMIVQAISPQSPAHLAGIQPGDQLETINGIKLYSLKQLMTTVEAAQDNQSKLGVLRSGKLLTLPINPVRTPYTHAALSVTLQADPQQSISMVTTNEIEEVSISNILIYNLSMQAQAQFRDLSLGDILKQINYEPVHNLDQAYQLLNQTKKSGPIRVVVQHAGQPETNEVMLPESSEIELHAPKYQYILGLNLKSIITKVHENPKIQLCASIKTTLDTLKSLFSYNSSIKLNQLMGPPGIIRTLHTVSIIDWRLMLWFVMVMNVNLAIINLLPIPVLDGGHILFAYIQACFKKVTSRHVQIIQSIFILGLISLMIYISFFDLKRWQADRVTSIQNAYVSKYYLRDMRLF